ncbi:hypothetical protein G7Y89_g13432 [Cudoniella acicularis]|uniref:DUF6604 domain-containing protein n=1 Tax=Cudoniella acicularis TaxID=354080 RepID=A0A8H4R8J8_9HELO|nr:hypothetical protein G7Y89_g13432 [Cudoniella acicularis]
MILKSLNGTYHAYKADTTKFTTWLASTAIPCGYKIPYSTAAPVTETTTHKIKEGWLKGKARKAAKLEQTARLANQQSAIKHAIMTAQLSEQGRVVASHKKPPVTVPIRIQYTLKRAIAARQHCASDGISSRIRESKSRNPYNTNLLKWFRKAALGTTSPDDDISNAGHQYFITVLQELFDTLEPRFEIPNTAMSAPSTKSGTQAQRTNNAANMFEMLGLEETELHHQTEPTKQPGGVTDQTTQHSRASRAADVFELAVEASDELLFIVFCFFEDLKATRLFLQKTWEDVAQEKIDSVAASITTNAALELIMIAEDEFDFSYNNTHPDPYSDHIQLIHPSFSDSGQVNQEAMEKFLELDSVFYYSTYLSTVTFRNSVQQLKNSTYSPASSISSFGPEILDSYSNKDWQAEDKFLNQILLELQLFAMFRYDYELYKEAANSVFAARVLLDIHKALGSETAETFKNLLLRGATASSILSIEWEDIKKVSGPGALFPTTESRLYAQILDWCCEDACTRAAQISEIIRTYLQRTRFIELKDIIKVIECTKHLWDSPSETKQKFAKSPSIMLPDSLAGKARKQVAAKSSLPRTSRITPQTRYSTHTISTNELIAQAKMVASHKKLKTVVLIAVQYILEHAIEARLQCLTWFQNVKTKGETANHKSANERHRYFIDILQEVADILKPCFESLKTRNSSHSERAIPEIRSITPTQLSSRFQNLNLEELDEQAYELLSTASVATSSTSKSNAREAHVYELSTDIGDELPFIVYCLLEDLLSIRNFVQQSWTGITQGEYNVMATSLVTNMAIQLAHRYIDATISLSDDLRGSHTYYKVLRQLHPFTGSQNARQSFMTSCQVNAPVMAALGIQDVDRTLKQMLLNMDVLATCEHKPGGVKRGQPTSRFVGNTYRHIPTKDEITSDLQCLAANGQLNLEPVFTAAILLDIYEATGSSISNAYQSLLLKGLRALEYLDIKWHEYRVLDTPPESLTTREEFLAAWGGEDTANQARDLSYTINEILKRNKIAEIKIEMPDLFRPISPQPDKIMSSQDPFFVNRNNPLLSGLESLRIGVRLQKLGIDMANTWCSIALVAQIYNALRQLGFMKG